MKYYQPEHCHNAAFTSSKPSLTFDPKLDYETYHTLVNEKFRELLGDMPERGPLEMDIHQDRLYENFREIRFSFLSERYAHVPCHLLLPHDIKEPVPVVICLQGHSTGMHISLGRPIFPKDVESIKGGRDIAIQAVKRGYAALVIEQRGLGEREDKRPWADKNFRKCHHPSMSALLIGRTMIGERVWDVSRAIDALSFFSEINMGEIYCTGNSGGGTVTYYSACFDSRIKVAIPSCAVCSFASSIGKMNHCQCNYIPGILKYFDMGELACLISPRKLLVVAGRHDSLFPIHGTQEVFKVIQAIYTQAGAPNSCRLLIGDGGHQYYPDLVWPALT